MDQQTATALWLCKKCGASERNSRGSCKACASAARLKYRLAHPDRVKESTKKFAKKRVRNNQTYFAARYAERKEQYAQQCKKWRLENPGKHKANTAAWYAKNAADRIAKVTAWAAANPDKRKATRNNRRARKKLVNGSLSKDLVSKLYLLQKGKCPCCAQPLGDDYHLDHKMPLALGGLNVDTNMQLLRAKCNLQKAAKHPIEFMQSRGFLL